MDALLEYKPSKKTLFDFLEEQFTAKEEEAQKEEGSSASSSTEND